MQAMLEKAQNGYKARIELHLRHSVEEVWSWMTENVKLKQWFSELRIDDLRKGGINRSTFGRQNNRLQREGMGEII